MKPLLYKGIFVVIIVGCIFLGFTVYNLKRENTKLHKELTEQFFKESDNRAKLIDSLSQVTIVIKQEILNNESSIKKIEDELKKNKTDSLTLEQALKLLGL